MKKLKFILIFALMFSFSLNSPAAEDYVFSVLASNGDVKIKKEKQAWKKLKSGSKLYKGDKVKLTGKSYVGLVHSSGKTLQVKGPKEYSIDGLSGKISKNSSVTGRFTQFIINEMQETENMLADDNYNMDVTGSVERDVALKLNSGSPMFKTLTPRKMNLVSNTVGLEWNKVEGAEYYKLTITDRFDRVVHQKDVKSSSVSLNLSELNIERDVYYFWHVSKNGDENYRSEEACFLLYSDSRKEEIEKNLQALKNELGDTENAVSKVILGFFFEQNNMIGEAEISYKKAVELADGVDEYEKIYDRFLHRVSIGR